ncbi:hypothetical protein E4U53_002340 [Claviceps sorghi]|nr:hypothetical protein E4U53_002340 [Claviceps sorghi]
MLFRSILVAVAFVSPALASNGLPDSKPPGANDGDYGWLWCNGGTKGDRGCEKSGKNTYCTKRRALLRAKLALATVPTSVAALGAFVLLRARGEALLHVDALVPPGLEGGPTLMTRGKAVG